MPPLGPVSREEPFQQTTSKFQSKAQNSQFHDATVVDETQGVSRDEGQENSGTIFNE